MTRMKLLLEHDGAIGRVWLNDMEVPCTELTLDIRMADIPMVTLTIPLLDGVDTKSPTAPQEPSQ